MEELKRDWIIPSNPKFYDTTKAFRELKKLDWNKGRNLNNIQDGDIVYIYISGNLKAIQFKCKVTKSHVESREIDDMKYYVKPEDASDGPFVELEMVKEYKNLEDLNIEKLREHGIKRNVQCSQKVVVELSEYVERVGK